MAEEENVEMMEQKPVEIAEGAKRQVPEKEEVPESKKARAIGDLPACITPIRLCEVGVGEYAADPACEKDLSNVKRALSGKLLPAGKAKEGRA